MLIYIDPKQRPSPETDAYGASFITDGRALRCQENLWCPIRHWWWDGMYSDTQEFTRNCPQCTVVTGGGQHHRPPLHPIPVSRPFQIVGVDVMELPRTDRVNRCVGFPGFPHQVAAGVPNARPEKPMHR